MTGLLKGLSHLKGHIFKLGLVNIPECGRCKQASQLFVAEALPALRFMHLGHCFMKQGDLGTSLSAGFCALFKVWGC